MFHYKFFLACGFVLSGITPVSTASSRVHDSLPGPLLRVRQFGSFNMPPACVSNCTTLTSSLNECDPDGDITDLNPVCFCNDVLPEDLDACTSCISTEDSSQSAFADELHKEVTNICVEAAQAAGGNSTASASDSDSANLPAPTQDSDPIGATGTSDSDSSPTTTPVHGASIPSIPSDGGENSGAGSGTSGNNGPIVQTGGASCLSLSFWSITGLVLVQLCAMM